MMHDEYMIAFQDADAMHAYIIGNGITAQLYKKLLLNFFFFLQRL